MASVLSKRQQARNEKALQDLVLSVPGNNFCADCQARNPAWASWSLGVFLCMRCAAIHRKLGTHVSKVKSLSMDSWSTEQVENMKKVGNITSNKIYNPQNKKPPVPVDADEADAAMERFIKSKYIINTTTTPSNGTKRHNIEADEGTPPPLPPKTPGKFGFRSASSIFPLSSRAKKEAAMRNNLSSPHDNPRSMSPRMINKPSKVFGASVQYDAQEDTDQKLASLRDMGFTDSHRNAVVLRGVNGSLERAIEALVRLGEGDRKSSPGPLTSPRESSLRATRSLTPMTPNSGSGAQQSAFYDQPNTPSTLSSNPFDMLPAQPQSSQSTGTLQNKNPYYSPNAFGAPMQQQDMINQAFHGLSLAPSQPLFPHHTGGIPAPPLLSQQQQQQPMYQQSMTPPIQSAQQNYAPMTFNNNMTYPQPIQSQQTGYNPFFANQMQVQMHPQMLQQMPQMQQMHHQVLSVNTATMPGNLNSNPFTRSPTRIQSPTPLGQIPEQSQTSYYGSPQPQAAQGINPFFAQAAPAQVQQQMPMHMAQSMYTPQRPDTASIMALYNYPQLAPQPIMNQTQVQQPQAVENQPPQQTAQVSHPQMSGNKNPFLQNGGSLAPVAAATGVGADPMAAHKPLGHASRESMALGMDMAWSNGRHSPDAFASLSARHR